MNVITLRQAGTQARILPDFGFNCFELQIPHQNRPVDVLWAEEGFDQGDKRPSGSGIPLLFPFPGRIAGTTLEWQGRTYSLEAGDGRGNAIHGFVLNRPWRVLEQSAHHAVGQFQASKDDPSILDHWPADFRITARYAVEAGRLHAQYTLENPDSQPLPWGFGTHPYFRLPLGGKQADACRITLPVRQEWVLKEMIPTGAKRPLMEPTTQAFAGLQRDNVYTDLLFDDAGQCRPAILDPRSGARLTLQFDRAFRECVVYTPPHREAICIEPYTCLPGAFHLHARGFDTGIEVLQPGGQRTTRMTISLSG